MCISIFEVNDAIHPLFEQTKKFPNWPIPKQTVLDLQEAIRKAGQSVRSFTKEDRNETDYVRNQAIRKLDQIVIHNKKITERNKTIAKVCLAAFTVIAVYRSYA
jgi:hypothetical protein